MFIFIEIFDYHFIVRDRNSQCLKIIDFQRTLCRKCENSKTKSLFHLIDEKGLTLINQYLNYCTCFRVSEIKYIENIKVEKFILKTQLLTLTFEQKLM